jgi:hypothetical protein
MLAVLCAQRLRNWEHASRRDHMTDALLFQAFAKRAFFTLLTVHSHSARPHLSADSMVRRNASSSAPPASRPESPAPEEEVDEARVCSL